MGKDEWEVGMKERGWNRDKDGYVLAQETRRETGWRFSGLRSQMQSESKVLSSSIAARGALLQPQSSLHNWDLVLSLSGTAVLNMISGPPAALSPPKKLWRPQARTCSLPYRLMSVLLSLDMQSDSWRRARLGGWVTGFIPHMFIIWAAFLVVRQGGKAVLRSNSVQNKHWQTGQTKWIYFPLSSRITGWRLRIWRLFLISSTHLPRTCRTSSQAGGAAGITMGEPLASCPMTFLPLWWTWSLQPKAFWHGWTGEICKKARL